MGFLQWLRIRRLWRNSNFLWVKRPTVAALTRLLGRLARAIFSPPGQNDVNLASSATLNAQIWLGQFPWRPTAGWTVVVALLATGLVARRFDIDWKTLALLLLLVDPLWGSLWRLAAGRAELLPLHNQAVSYEVWLPYLRPGSPAARLLGWNNAGALPLLFRVALPSLFLTGALAVVLGRAGCLADGCGDGGQPFGLGQSPRITAHARSLTQHRDDCAAVGVDDQPAGRRSKCHPTSAPNYTFSALGAA